jgi:hypothetical protein
VEATHPMMVWSDRRLKRLSRGVRQSWRMARVKERKGWEEISREWWSPTAA